jgi:hypothetical protein
LKDNIKTGITWHMFLKKKTGRVLLLIVILASATMIIMNYYTIKILSAARAYINGESQYSKGQKDASAHLINYIYLEDPGDYTAFEQNISVPEGCRIARIALIVNDDQELAKKGFLQGRNHPDDIDDMVWLFSNLKGLPLFKKAIGIWTDGDAMVRQLQMLGLQARKKVISDKITAEGKKALILSTSNVSKDLTIKE